ncbi:lysyl-tRNA synthetase-like protein [Glonium stellatum]|uniref:Lysyl-tRNA synthetase n=1 Tax=Glonium stellatum TaxID=574774 RepID=A0A8E2F7W9_9PEZI|nr:lysyl-tRNA synthetase-like protein [Glonium stellatum]
MSRNACRFLRPYLSRGFEPTTKSEHAQLYCSIQRRFAQTLAEDIHTSPSSSHDVEKRLAQLKKAGHLRGYHPRLKERPGIERLTPKAFHDAYKTVQDTKKDMMVEIFGRVRSLRLAGSKLAFIDIERQDGKVQGYCDFKVLADHGVTAAQFRQFKQMARKGDWFSITGHPTRTTSGELSILVTELPQALSPSLHQIPSTIDDPETLMRHPHVHQLINRQRGDILRLRSHIYQLLQTFFVQDGFIQVETPMFDAGAGGAIARPFETAATELSNTTLRLRIAPELYLKRLVIAGNEKVFELGRVFRNEGVDATHNPEFTICEFYEVGAHLEDLISKTERLLRQMAAMVQELKTTQLTSLSPPDIDFSSPFQRLPFIPTIESAINRSLPDLSSPTAQTELLSLFSELNITPPTNPILSRLLDTLAELYIEPLCTVPTFITHHPEPLSPLSKSYLDPTTNQLVSARVELFIHGREYVNAYEEENSPFEQRRKFEQQLEYQQGKAEAGVSVDESYIEALEWGMPPTGGWGCGVDRLVMLFSGCRRIADVLPFGTLRNIVAIAGNGRRGV